MLTVVAFARCSEATAPDRISAVAVTPGLTTLLVGPGGGQTAQLTAAASTSSGAAKPGVAVTWSTADGAVIAVSPSGLVSALAPGSATVRATVGTISGTAAVVVLPVPAATVTLSRDSLVLRAGVLGNETSQLSAIQRDSTGAALAGRPLAWSSRDTLVVRVSNTGLVTAVGAGGTRVVATTERGGTDSVVVTVTRNDTLPDAADIRIVAVNWTQGVQTDSSTIPIVRGGRPAVVNVLLAATQEITAPSKVVLRLLDRNGTVVRADTASVVVAPGLTPSFAAPQAQFLVPNAQLAPGTRWQVIRDPAGLMPDSSSANDRYPRGGPAVLPLVDVPPLRIRFIPITLTAHGNVTGNVSQANLAEYLRVVRAVHPHGAIEASIGDPLPSNRSFGTPPNGGQSAFWIGVLTDVDAARIADPSFGDAHWVGIVAPPAGFTFAAFGGFGYIPANGTSVGPGTRTTTLVNVGWFSRESQSRELVAHELGHNFGRQHAPCGGAGGPDANFPNTSGTIGDGAHDVNAWALGLLNSAPAIASGTGDVMGYCTPVWASRYTYEAILNFRTSTPAALQAPLVVATRAPQRALVVRGTVTARGVSLEPAITVDVTAMSDDTGDHLVEGLSADGRVLFRRAFRTAALDHDATVRPFTVTVPVTEAMEQALVTITVRGPGGQVRRDRTRTADATATEAPAISGRTLSCPAGTERLVAQDDATGRVLGSALGRSLTLPRPLRGRVRVACSDGVRTRTTAITPG